MVIGLVLGIFIGVGSYFSTKRNQFNSNNCNIICHDASIFLLQWKFCGSGFAILTLAELQDGTSLERRLEDLAAGFTGNTGNEEQY